MPVSQARQEEIPTSGGFRSLNHSARAGYLPICLTRTPVAAFEGIPIHLRSQNAEPGKGKSGRNGAPGDVYSIYRPPELRFTEDCRQRLLLAGVRFVYIPVSYHEKFRQQIEAQIQEIVDDPDTAASVKWEIVYETSNELVDELLTETNLGEVAPRLQNISKAVTTMVLNDPMAFEHLFAASHHDFYTATHMVNVATWMVPLAYALGHHDMEELSLIFQAGMLHDIGKILVPGGILNKQGKLSASDWVALRQHTELGSSYLKDAGIYHPLIHAVTRQHHERLDGGGYPDGLRGDQIDPIANICAVIDSFDALTALRPFKTRALTVAQAMEVLFDETPHCYDRKVVETWTDLIKRVDEGVSTPAMNAAIGRNRRKYHRFSFSCRVMVTVLDGDGRPQQGRPDIGAVAHNISRSGVGLLLPQALLPGESVRIHLQPSRGVNVKSVYDAVVVRCRAYDDGWYEVGVMFGTPESIAR